MTEPRRPIRLDVDAARAEALERAHDRVEPDAVLDALAALELYVEAFLAGAAFAANQNGGRA